ncbi:hypothetical protein NKR23_g8982 [Pleurostoma richardsiae]|uniref:Uncharacterized protein n=1 Tax=Pleurostoma richardsiae TaxID=41990 RepID=A0AA38VF70_9PEZI|nr:hypothetical protein NKR23_g8982 [Pleurostoma richardsiae]
METIRSSKQASLSIFIFRGKPLDAYPYRHTGLFIEHPDQDRRFIHLIGFAGGFVRDESRGRTPRCSDLFAGSVPIATIPASRLSDLRSAIWTTAVNNAEHDWNCHNWVGDALQSCTKAGLISMSEADAALDGMAEILLQAPYTS